MTSHHSDSPTESADHYYDHYYREGDYQEELLFLQDAQLEIDPQLFKAVANFIAERLPLGQQVHVTLEDDCVYALSDDGTCVCALEAKHQHLVEEACRIINRERT